mgnify:CR=1 FL=1
MNHENTKSKKHEMFRNIFVFSFFRDFVMEVFNSTLDVRCSFSDSQIRNDGNG